MTRGRSKNKFFFAVITPVRTLKTSTGTRPVSVHSRQDRPDNPDGIDVI
jgi:hypothetical protein